MIEDATKPIAASNSSFMEPHITPAVFAGSDDDDAVSLDLKEAAFVLGKSMRALERSLTGKWGNRLPDGWSARRQLTNGVESWRIIPPEGFNLEPLYEHQRGAQPQFELLAARTRHHSQALLSVWKKDDEVITALKELAAVHKELAQEKRAHLEDLRLLAQLQSSMRLLECNASETSQLKTELMEAQKDLIALKNEYQTLLKLPWWKRIFKQSY